MLYPYEILGISENADQNTLRKAYLEKIRRYTPEDSPEMFGKIVDAYALVKDETARAKLRRRIGIVFQDFRLATGLKIARRSLSGDLPGEHALDNAGPGDGIHSPGGVTDQHQTGSGNSRQGGQTGHSARHLL